MENIEAFPANIQLNLISFLSTFKKELVKHMKKCPISAVIKKMQIKTKMRYLFASIRMAITEKTNKQTNKKPLKPHDPTEKLKG